MRSRDALRLLAEVTESQWGMVTSAQAKARGVSPMNLSRLTESGDLVRLSHGVYRDAGAPSGEHDELRAAWLAIDPARLAYDRLSEIPTSAVVSGESASRLHRIGDFRAMRSEFTLPRRRQTQRSDVRYRSGVLPHQDVAIHEGLPVTTRERTIADLVRDRHDLSLVGDALRDAARQSRLDVERLVELLSPLAARHGHRKGDGEALLHDLMQIAGIDVESLARQVAAVPDLAARVAAAHLKQIDFAPLERAFHARLTEQLNALAEHAATRIPEADVQARAAAMSEALRDIVAPKLREPGGVNAAIASFERAVQARLAQQLNALDWTTLAQATRSAKGQDAGS